jgi:hypothetical protein
MGWSAISASYTTQTGSYQSLVSTGVNTALNASEGTITAGSNWSAITDGHAFAVVRAGAIICVRCAKSVSTTTLTYYRLYLADGSELVTDVQVGDTIELYERDNTVGSGTALGSVAGIVLSSYSNTSYSLLDFNAGNNGLKISGYYQISALGRVNFDLSAPINQIDQLAGGHLALGQYRTANGVTVRSSRMVAHLGRNNANQSFIRTSSTSRTDWFGGTIFAATGTIATTSGGHGLKIYGPECVFVGLSGLSAIRLSSANDYIYGATLDLAGYVPLNTSAVANGIIPKNCDQAFGLSSSSPAGFISFSGWNFTGAGNNVDISFWNSKWSWCRNSSVGSALTCQGNSLNSVPQNRGLTKVTQDVAFAITNPAGAGLDSRIFIRDTDNGNRLSANQIGSNPSYLADNTYEATTSAGVGALSDVLLRVVWQNIANVAVDRYTGIGDDYRGLDNSSTDRFRVALACYGYDPATTVQVLKSTSAKAVAYTMLADAGVTAAKATAATYTDRFSIDASGNITVTANATLDQLYDYAQIWLETSGANMEAAGLGAKLASWSGTSITATKNLTVNTGVTLSSGTKFTSITAVGTLTITGSMDVVSYTSPAGTFVQLSVGGVRNGTKVRVVRTDTSAELAIGTAGASGFSVVLQYTADLSVRADATYTSGLDCEAEASALGTLTANGASLTIVQSPCTIYENNGIDGSTVTGLTLDAPNIEIDADEADNAMTVQEIYAWFKNELMTDSGIRTLFGAITAENAHKYRINASVVPLKIDQKDLVNSLVLSGGMLYRDDGVALRLAGSGVIEFVLDDVYESSAAEAALAAIKAKTDNLIFTGGSVQADVQAMNGAEVIGTGTTGDAWRGVGVLP